MFTLSYLLLVIVGEVCSGDQLYIGVKRINFWEVHPQLWSVNLFIRLDRSIYFQGFFADVDYRPLNGQIKKNWNSLRLISTSI